MWACCCVSTIAGAGGVLLSPWLRLYKVVGEVPRESDLISGVTTPGHHLTLSCNITQYKHSYITSQVRFRVKPSVSFRNPGTSCTDPAGSLWICRQKINFQYLLEEQTLSLMGLLESSRPWTVVSNWNILLEFYESSESNFNSPEWRRRWMKLPRSPALFLQNYHNSTKNFCNEKTNFVIKLYF